MIKKTNELITYIMVCMLWPVFFYIVINKYIVDQKFILYLFGSIPSTVFVVFFKYENDYMLYMSCMIWLLIIVLIYVKRKKNTGMHKIYYMMASMYSLASCLLGCLIILGQHV